MRLSFATIDFETRSRLNIKDVGAWRYSVDPSTDILCLAYAIDDGPVRRWKRGDPLPRDLRRHVVQGGMLEAHNSFFEWCIWHNVGVRRLGWPRLKRKAIHCSAAKSAVMCLPRALEHAAFHAGCEERKGDSSAMKKLSKPRKPTKKNPKEWIDEEDDPALFEELYTYNDQDVVTERDLSDRLPALSPSERRVFLADMNINLRGVRCDRQFVYAGLKVGAQIEREICGELCELSDGAIMAATERDRILAYLDDECGLKMPKLDKETVEDYLYTVPLTKKQRRILTLREEGSRSSVSKYKSFAAVMDPADDCVRGLYLYYGANAHGRFSGRLVQPQNFPRGDAKGTKEEKGGETMERMVRTIIKAAKTNNTELLREGFQVEEMVVAGDPKSGRRMVQASPAEVLSTALRGGFIARAGKVFGVGDYSAIEARKVFWFAEEKRGLNIMAAGGDIYRDQGSVIFNKKPEDLDVGFERMMGKTVVLGCGYGMGWKKFKLTCKRSYGMNIDDDLCKRSVYAYRDRYEAVPKFWERLDRGAKRCIRSGRMVDVGLVTFWMNRYGSLCIRLPSGRDIYLRHARISHDQIVFTNGKGYSESTYGGKLCEYICSGSARDVLADAIAMAEFDWDDVEPVMHSHDELVCEGEAGKVGKIVEKIMADAVAEYEGLPMKIETWEGPRYHK